MKAIVVQNLDSVPISIGAEFTLRAETILAEAKKVTAVTDAASQEIAVQTGSKIRALRNELEKARTEVKKPVLDIGRKIDDVAKKAAAPLTLELDRIEKTIRQYVLAEQEKARKLADFQAKMEAKKRARLEAEAAQAAAAGNTAVAEELTEKAQAPAAAPVVAAPPKVEKMTVRNVWKYEVTDLKALHAARPTLTKLEPSPSAIAAEIAAGMRECPGLRIWEDVDVTTRS